MLSSWTLLVSLAVLAVSPTSLYAAPTLESRALDYSIPSGWRSPTTSRSLDERKAISKAAASRMLELKGSYSNQNIGNLGYWPSANAWTEIVDHDFAAGTKDFAGSTLDGVGDTFGQHNAFRANEYNDDTLWWGFAAIYQYRTYGDTTALGWAKSNWDNIIGQQVTGTSGSGKSFTWPDTCNGKSNHGGVFWRNTADDAYVNAITTNLFMALSAHLYDLVGDQKYLDAANNARDYVKNHLLRASDSLVQDGMNIQNCAITDWTFTYNQGKFIEALAMLYGKTGNADYLNDALNTAVSSMKGTNYQGSDGIITEGQETPYENNGDGRNFKGIYLRALGVLYRHTPSDSPARALLRAYTNVQANALIDLASNGNRYGVNWHGPMDAGYAHGQLAALDALANFVSLN